MKGSLREGREGDLFRSRLDSILNMSHEICQLANELDWGWLDEEL